MLVIVRDFPFFILVHKFIHQIKGFVFDILHVAEINKNLLSVKKIYLDNHVFFEFHYSFFVVRDESTHITLLTAQ